MQYYVAVIDYPDQRRRPAAAQLAGVHPVTFEMTILLRLVRRRARDAGAERPADAVPSVFNVERFALATRNRFFLCIEATDPKFDREKTADFSKAWSPRGVRSCA